MWSLRPYPHSETLQPRINQRTVLADEFAWRLDEQATLSGYLGRTVLGIQSEEAINSTSSSTWWDMMRVNRPISANLMTA